MEHNITENPRLRSIDKGTLFSPGESDHIYFVRSGLIRLYVVDEEGTGTTLRYVKANECFGEETMLDLPRAYFGETMVPSVIELCPKDELDAAQVRLLSSSLIRSVSSLTFRLSLTTKFLPARVAAELLELSDTVLATPGRDGMQTIRVTHEMLAKAVGSVRESVTKALGELARAGAVHLRYGRVVVVDADKLRQAIGAPLIGQPADAA